MCSVYTRACVWDLMTKGNSFSLSYFMCMDQTEHEKHKKTEKSSSRNAWKKALRFYFYSTIRNL